LKKLGHDVSPSSARDLMKKHGLPPVPRGPPQSPMCNAYAERLIRETREALDNLILLGEQHFRHVLTHEESLYAEHAIRAGAPGQNCQT
jgi:hypothetical protein